ncbi:hypothetical protein [Nostoc sp. TCL26-01]|uniref:hypothetical protein n=1 Tax=Nostoc sp. TCL26-01 TaxID=2576904 RepID=UPI0015C1B55F|nr:hypothetical protein [Nostoc sp. TCL26-01]QLE59909.1 hypothetical protein FD725_31285 [Nostoc sp. TCL26-01]
MENNTILEDLEFRLRTRTFPDTSEAILLNYLNSKATLYPSKDMAMIALMSYWLPLAYRAAGYGAKENLEQSIKDCIYRLKLHQQYLQEMLTGGLGSMANDLIESPPTNSHLGQLSTTQPEQSLVTNNVQDNPADVTTLQPNDLPVDTPREEQEWFNPLEPR